MRVFTVVLISFYILEVKKEVIFSVKGPITRVKKSGHVERVYL